MHSQRILILMSNTGGGHRASAEALKAGFAQRFGDRFQVEIVDLLIDHLPWPLNDLPKTYSFMANRATWVWKLLWETEHHPEAVHKVANLAAQITQKAVSAVLERYQPDLIISVHPLVQEMTLYTLGNLGGRIPFVTVITDLATVHPLWFHPDAACCYVASEEAYQRGLQAGLRPEQLRLYGLPVRPVFALPLRPQLELRRDLGLLPELPVVLLISGGDGIGPVGKIARQVAKRLANGDQPLGQLVIICGHNRKLRSRLVSRPWPIPTQIHGFVNNMHEWMGAVDCIITKAGPGTIAEALIRRLPIVLSGFIPGQEEGNIPFVVDNGVGVLLEDPKEIAACIGRWFTTERDLLTSMAERACQLGRPNATMEIVESIVGLLAPVDRSQ